MPTKYEIWLTDEIEGAQLDLETATTVTEEEQELLRDLRYEQAGHTFHRLGDRWLNHKAGTLVLYDGQEVLVFLVGPK